MKTITLQGTVLRGEGVGTKYVNFPWAKKQFIQKLGFAPYPGTLNLWSPLETKIKDLMETAKGIQIKPPIGFFSGKCFKALVTNSIKGAVIKPEVPDYPADLLEVLAPVNLRKTLQIKDGEKVQIAIYLSEPSKKKTV
jgi:riboflavin kinase